MVFWIVAAAMTAAAILAIVWPLLRRGQAEVDTAADHDVEVYLSQLRELDGDVARGTMAEAEAASARAEVGRRLLRASEKARREALTDGTRRSFRRPAVLAAAAGVAVLLPGLSFALYETVGAPALPDQPLAFRQQPKPQDDFDLAGLVGKAEARLKENPKDGNGWDVLAPIYLRMNRPEDAAEAFRKAIALNGESAARFGGLGEALTDAASGEVTDAAKAAFAKALAINPAYLPAKFFLALDASQEQRAADAETRWSALISESPPDAPWLKIAEAGLADARQRLGKPAAATAVGDAATVGGEAAAPGGAAVAEGEGSPGGFEGPDAATVAAASQMAAGDRQAMIEGMVAQLAARLKQHPDDVEGWKRLIRSYTVLGKTDEAQTALADARKAFPEASAGAREIAAFAAEIGLPGKEEATSR
ncbi:c-type cytochrome biogenesis protein CcmI [Jiella sonneratiae]|uniref:C-type cytochrome biogenesis protein CcmI n=1 Tax=Jiella sonneratiae TaxID=2816856 RepID=A0ABS3J5I9_9HYPH|nr:c-type cytochrome biogenesis protein CcmI [Jiella sonneratiae]MBO0904933.1 c-type cytochrome biogenesis protein CcmI [Jiella sonneratiae]